MSNPAQPSFDPTPATGRGALAMRLLHMILVSLLIGAATAVLNVLAVVQIIVMLIGGGQANAQIAAFGKAIGQWLSRAARFQAAETEEKPWPWSPLD